MHDTNRCSIIQYNCLLDDDNRVVLGVCGPYKDEYVNASPLDVSSIY